MNGLFLHSQIWFKRSSRCRFLLNRICRAWWALIFSFLCIFRRIAVRSSFRLANCFDRIAYISSDYSSAWSFPVSTGRTLETKELTGGVLPVLDWCRDTAAEEMILYGLVPDVPNSGNNTTSEVCRRVTARIVANCNIATARINWRQQTFRKNRRLSFWNQMLLVHVQQSKAAGSAIGLSHSRSTLRRMRSNSRQSQISSQHLSTSSMHLDRRSRQLCSCSKQQTSLCN